MYEAEYLRRYRRWILIVIGLIVASMLTIFSSLVIGSSHIPYSTIFEILAKQIPLLNVDNTGISKTQETIVLQIRMPRVLAAALVGAALATAGTVLQGIFRNPMADPYVIGISAGAALGASIAIVLGAGFTFLGLSPITVSAFIGSLIAVFIVYNVSRVGSGLPVTTLLLSGIAVSFFLSSVVAFLMVMAGRELHAIVFWLMGSFSYVEWRYIWAASPYILVSLAIIYLYARDLNILTLGEEGAKQLGVDVEKAKKILLVLASLMTASAVSISGTIGFVGLMVPHITRILVGPDHRILIPASALVGVIFLVVCDDVARVIISPAELPIGIITNSAGAALFIYLLRRRKKEYAL